MPKTDQVRWYVRWTDSPSAIFLIGIAVALTILLFGVLFLKQGREDAFTLAREQSRDFGLLVERDISRNLESYGLSLQGVVEGYADPDALKLPEIELRRILFDKSTDARYVKSVLVADRFGDIVLSSRSDLVIHRNIAAERYFSMPRDETESHMFVSRPTTGIADPFSHVVVLSRSLHDVHGIFSGVALLELDLQYFSDLLAVVKMGPSSAATLISDEGIMMMRRPFRPQDIGINVAHSKNFQRMVKADETSFVNATMSDGVRRLIVSKRIENFPLFIVFAPAESDIYAVWWRRATPIILLTVLFSASMFFGMLMLSRQMRVRMRVERNLSKLARTDGLTGLTNRRTLDETLRREWRRAERQRSWISLLFIDIDYFKVFNDKYGHQAGDDILKRVAQTVMRHARRPGDIAARYGGEEFMLILPDTAGSGAKVMAHELRSAVEALNVAHLGSSYGFVTISIGVVSVLVPDAPPLEEAIEVADQALYRAKEQGRNRVVHIEIQGRKLAPSL